MAGWLTVIGWQATYATAIYLNGTYIAAMISLTHSDYVPQAWHMTLYSYATALIGLAINCVGGKLLPRFEGTILILHILGFFAILIPLTYMADHKSAKEVFTHFLNEGQWPTQGLSFFIGLIGPVFAFAGGDAAVHVCHQSPSWLLSEDSRLLNVTPVKKTANRSAGRWQKRFPTPLPTCPGR